jgi:hypothetical protein
MISGTLIEDAVLAVHEAVVGGEDHQRVAQLAALAQGGHDLGHGVVDGQQRLQLLPVVLLDPREQGRGQARAMAHEGRLVGHRLLVEAGRPG